MFQIYFTFDVSSDLVDVWALFCARPPFRKFSLSKLPPDTHMHFHPVCHGGMTASPNGVLPVHAHRKTRPRNPWRSADLSTSALYRVIVRFSSKALSEFGGPDQGQRCRAFGESINMRSPLCPAFVSLICSVHTEAHQSYLNTQADSKGRHSAKYINHIYLHQDCSADAHCALYHAVKSLSVS